ncbi:MAG: RNA-binding S4 domain-containing protein [Bacteroidales bacterium]|nr:RNA-binding S4 domain-containing protein [Bacteroidales bacterium]MDE7072969.1 RNA-binding S4 domain-containing protein [Bacteroidales bacterium]
METIGFDLREGEDFIPLIQLLKAVDVVESGSMAQECVSAGLVRRNGEIELRKRAKIRSGEVIVFDKYEIRVR